jgi:hypothetical protein
MRIALIGCSKRKNEVGSSGFIKARDLYAGELFKKRVALVESKNIPWYILSAKSGLLKPFVPVRTYDYTFAQMTELERAEWHVGVANQLFSELFYTFGDPKLSTVTIEFHCGSDYCEPLATILGLFGVKSEKPVAGLGIGQQLKFYSGAK